MEDLTYEIPRRKQDKTFKALVLAMVSRMW